MVTVIMTATAAMIATDMREVTVTMTKITMELITGILLATETNTATQKKIIPMRKKPMDTTEG